MMGIVSMVPQLHVDGLRKILKTLERRGSEPSLPMGTFFTRTVGYLSHRCMPAALRRELGHTRIGLPMQIANAELFASRHDHARHTPKAPLHILARLMRAPRGSKDEVLPLPGPSSLFFERPQLHGRHATLAGRLRDFLGHVCVSVFEDRWDVLCRAARMGVEEADDLLLEQAREDLLGLRTEPGYDNTQTVCVLHLQAMNTLLVTWEDFLAEVEDLTASGSFRAFAAEDPLHVLAQQLTGLDSELTRAGRHLLARAACQVMVVPHVAIDSVQSKWDEEEPKSGPMGGRDEAETEREGASSAVKEGGVVAEDLQGLVAAVDGLREVVERIQAREVAGDGGGDVESMPDRGGNEPLADLTEEELGRVSRLFESFTGRGMGSPRSVPPSEKTGEEEEADAVLSAEDIDVARGVAGAVGADRLRASLLGLEATAGFPFQDTSPLRFAMEEGVIDSAGLEKEVCCGVWAVGPH